MAAELSELDIALDELEQRLDRLRALYQQYFLGIEKIEPNIARKDVERRIWQLRRKQIRNTGKRFKLNVLVQRYNTFQQYWTRICREIENGTYKRHLLRAQRRMGDEELLTIAARRGRGRRRQREEAQEETAEAGEAARQTAEQQIAAALDEGLDPLEDIRAAMDDALGMSAPPGAEAAAGAGQPSIPRAPPVPKSGGGITAYDLELDDGPETPRRPDLAAGRGQTGNSAGRTPTMVEQVADAPPPSGPPARPDPSGPPTPQAGAEPGPVPAPRSRLSQRQRARPVRPQAQAAKPGQSALSEQRLKQLHSRLVQAKRSTGDRGTVTEEGLAKSLRAAESKLRQKHGAGRRVDFDVVIKNGKAVVKPIVR